MSRRPTIPQRRRVFLGCEGESERSYGALLNRLQESNPRPVHIDPVLLGGGEPLFLLKTAETRMIQRIKQRGDYAVKAVLLDADRLGESEDRDREARSIASRLGLLLIWQTPIHEALLLRHLEGCASLRPKKPDAMGELKRRWPEYSKGMTAMQLARRIDRPGINRAAAAEEPLRRFLGLIGFGEA